MSTQFLNSDSYDRLFWEMVNMRNESLIEKNEDGEVVTNVEVHKWHDIVDLEPGTVQNSTDEYKKALLIEILTQFRDGEMIARYSFPGGFAVYQELGFSTDVSETCVWLSPLYVEPDDAQDFS